MWLWIKHWNSSIVFSRKEAFSSSLNSHLYPAQNHRCNKSKVIILIILIFIRWLTLTWIGIASSHFLHVLIFPGNNFFPTRWFFLEIIYFKSQQFFTFMTLIIFFCSQRVTLLESDNFSSLKLEITSYWLCNSRDKDLYTNSCFLSFLFNHLFSICNFFSIM